MAQQQKKNMKELYESFNQKDEILISIPKVTVNEKLLMEEFKTFRKNMNLVEGNTEELTKEEQLNEWINNPKLNFPNTMKYGTTVNTFIEGGTQEQNVKIYNPNFTYLQAHEALRVAVLRTCASGSPINKELGFYEEVNFNMINMGFNSSSAIDIKECLKKLIAGEI